MEEKHIYGALTVYRERGAFLRRLEQFEKAKTAYDEAELAKRDDVRTLIGRSRVCADAVELQLAYSDAERASQLEPSNMLAKNIKAQALYEMSEFEKSLVQNYRGQRVRKKPPYFTNGVNQGTETVEDCIGVNAGKVMLDFLPLIKKAEASRAAAADAPRTKRVSRIPVAAQKKQMSSIEARRHVTLARVLAMKYLGRTASDKFFLRELMKDPRIDSANARGSRELRQLVRDAYYTLRDRQEMLRTRRPYYTIKLAEAKDSQRMKEYKAKVLEREREISARICERMLKRLDQELYDTNIREFMARAERMQIYLDTRTEKTLLDKDIYVERLYRIIGDAFLSMNRLTYAMGDEANNRRVKYLMGMPVGRAKCFDSVITLYPVKFIDMKNTMSATKATLDAAEVPMMRCFLQHEMARLLVKQKNYALSKFYAKRCQKEAESIMSHAWWLNALFVLMSGDMQQGNTYEVRLAVDEGLAYAKRLNNMEALVSFLERCAEIAAAFVPPDERKLIEQREREILSVMEEKQRVETSVLFKRMSTVPPGRRFSVLPIRRVISDKAERRLLRQPGLTVVPGAPVALPPPPRSGVRGLQLFDL